MHHVFFVPGIMGSKLALRRPDGSDEEVWPPSVGEVLTGYRRIEKLIDKQVRSTGVIERQCVAFYGPILEALRDSGVTENGDKLRLVAWHYDWRMDLADTSKALADAFDQVMSSDSQARISIICHSMGGLVTRGCLEDPLHKNASWLDHVELVLFLATPHDGAPLALSRTLGVGGSSLGLNAGQLKILANQTGYPSAYQLLPGTDEPVAWRLDGLDPFLGQTIAQIAADPANGLNLQSLAAARQFRAKLDMTRRNPACRYFSVVSASHATATRFDAKGTQYSPVEPKSSGDGTVPVRSSAALPVQTGFVVADHVGVAKHDDAIVLALTLLGLRKPGPVPLGRAVSKLTLSVSPMVPANGEAWEIVIALPEGYSGFEGEIQIVPGPPNASSIQTIPIIISANGVTTLVLEGPSLPPGLYEVILFEGGKAQDSRSLLVSKGVMEDEA